MGTGFALAQMYVGGHRNLPTGGHRNLPTGGQVNAESDQLARTSSWQTGTWWARYSGHAALCGVMIFPSAGPA